MAFSDDLTTPHVPLHAIRPGLRLKPLQSHGAKLSDEEIDHVIARVLAEDRQLEARKALPAIASQEELSGHAGRHARRMERERQAAEARLDDTRLRYGADAAAEPVEDLRPGARLRAMRLMPSLSLPQLPALPKRARLGLAALAALAVLWFWTLEVLLVFAAMLTLCLAGVLALSSDTVSGALIRLYHWRHASNPASAERMRSRLDALAMRIDMLLDALPESWTAGLYMADFSREALGADMPEDTVDPFDRLRDDTARG